MASRTAAMLRLAAWSGVVGLLGSRAAVILNDAEVATDLTTERTTAVGATAVLQIDMFRAMQASDVDRQTTENNDLASVGGVVKYLHTEVIPEHTQDQTRTSRKYGIDTIIQRRFKVKNGADMPQDQVFYVDFGPFVTFDQGQSTNKDLDKLYQEHGDFVGVQANQHAGYKVSLDNPFYWFSVTGFCPNLPWTTLYNNDTYRCQMEGLCQAKGTKKNPNAKCLNYTKGDSIGKPVRGGLCKGGFDPNNTVPTKDPNGGDGCTYTYGEATAFSIDEIVGITSQDCVSGKCKDWADFRRNCVDDTLKRRFDPATNEIIDAKTPLGDPICVEYDMHPACQANCDDDVCKQAIADGKAEVGLAFWRGRCDPLENRRRMEIFAEAAGVDSAASKHQVVDDDIVAQDFPCRNAPDPKCEPATDNDMKTKGGPYCSRVFSGVCQECYIPGTKEPYRIDAETYVPVCPLSVLDARDYKASQYKPNCASKKPTDLCCLYTGTCSVSNDPAQAPLDDEGLTYLVSVCAKNRDTAALYPYMQRVAISQQQTLDDKLDAVQKFAYDTWAEVPRKMAYSDFAAAITKLATATTTTTVTLTTTKAGSGGGGGDNPSENKGGNGGTIAIIIILIVLAVGAGVGFFLMRQRGQAGRQPQGAEEGINLGTV